MVHSITDMTPGSKKAKILLTALVELAKERIPYSFFVSKIIWGVSLYLECGDFKVANWKTYPRVSDAARKIRKDGLTGWKTELRFEHARPLKQIYLLLQEYGPALTPERAAEIIAEYPPVLITKNEDDAINAKRLKSTGAPEERYAHIALSGFLLRSLQ
jgi:hypothetical protein